MITQVANDTTESPESMELIARLTRDLKSAAVSMTTDEARFLVDGYYMMQDQRIRTANQIRSMGESCEPHSVIQWFKQQSEILEKDVAKALDAYSSSLPLGRWAKSVCGIGPVITAGLLAHIKCSVPTVGHVWSFAGLNPSKTWEKGQKRPWNTPLKTLCTFKLGECFVKVQNRDSDTYGQYYAKRKQEEWRKNILGEFVYDAVKGAARVGKSTESYKWYSGKYSAVTLDSPIKGHVSDNGTDGVPMLPPAHIHARARRYAVKLFLSHYHAVGHYIETGKLPPLPYCFNDGTHAHLIAPPNMDMIDGMSEAWNSQPVR